MEGDVQVLVGTSARLAGLAGEPSAGEHVRHEIPALLYRDWGECPPKRREPPFFMCPAFHRPCIRYRLNQRAYTDSMRHRTESSQDGSNILMFGGQGGEDGEDYFNDLHLLDLKETPLNLQQLSAAGDPPPPRSSSTITAVSVSGRPGTEVAVVFGGFQGAHFLNSVYILQGDNSDSISDAASQHAGLIWTEPIVCAHSAEDGVPDARGKHSAVS